MKTREQYVELAHLNLKKAERDTPAYYLARAQVYATLAANAHPRVLVVSGDMDQVNIAHAIEEALGNG